MGLFADSLKLTASKKATMQRAGAAGLSAAMSDAERERAQQKIASVVGSVGRNVEGINANVVALDSALRAAQYRQTPPDALAARDAAARQALQTPAPQIPVQHMQSAPAHPLAGMMKQMTDRFQTGVSPLPGAAGEAATRIEQERRQSPVAQSLARMGEAAIQSKPVQAATKGMGTVIGGLATGAAKMPGDIAFYGRTLQEVATPKSGRDLIRQKLGITQPEGLPDPSVEKERISAGQQRLGSALPASLGVDQRSRAGTAFGIASSIPQMAALFLPGVGQAAFLGSAAGGAAQYAQQTGATPDQQAIYGAGSAATELLTEKLLFLVPAPVRKAATKLLGKQAGKALTLTRPIGEALQEAITGPITGTLEKFIFNPDKEWLGDDGVVDVAQMGEDAKAGLIMGVLFMGAASKNPEVKAAMQDIARQEVPLTDQQIQFVADLLADEVMTEAAPDAMPAQVAPIVAPPQQAPTQPAAVQAPSIQPQPSQATSVVPDAQPAPISRTLPKDLRGAKPRYKNSTLEFASDIDKALYIVGGTKKSTRHDRYVVFLSQFMTPEQIQEQSARIRNAVKSYTTGEEGFVGQIPNMSIDVETPTTPVTGVTMDPQRFGRTDEGAMAGRGRDVENKTSVNLAKGRSGNDAVTESFINDPMTHRTLQKEQVIDAMNAKMERYDGSTQSLDRIYNEWAERVEEGGLDYADIPLTRVLANEYSRQGNDAKAKQAWAITAAAGLTYGRFVNAFKYAYDALDPVHVSAGAQNIVDKLNDQGRERYGNKWKDVEYTKTEVQDMQDIAALRKQAGAVDAALQGGRPVPDISGRQATPDVPAESQTIADLRAQLVEISNMADAEARKAAMLEFDTKASQAQADLMDNATARWAETIPYSPTERWNYWRRFAMLTSPKTHIRNITSNVSRGILEGVKDTIGSVLETVTFVPKEQRLHAGAWWTDTARMDMVKTEWEKAMPELTHTIKYEVKSLPGLERRGQPLGKALGKASETVMNLLEKEDVPFMKFAFESSLAQQMKARGVNKASPEMVERAKRVALENTYKLENSISKAIMELKKNKKIGPALDVLMPFVRTPAAIAKTVAEFTPGLGAVNMAWDATHGRQFNRAEVTDLAAKQITGGILLYLGYAMAKAGLAYGEKEKSKKAAAFLEKATGRQPMSIRIGDGTYTVDWMQPTSSPFLIGVQIFSELEKASQKHDEGETRGKIMGDALTVAGLSMVDSFFDQSMLVGLNRFFSGDSFGESFGNLLVDYVAQGIPTLWTQLATWRAGYQPNAYSSGGTWGERQMRKLAARVAPSTVEPQVDVFGDEKSRSFLQSVVNPGFYKPSSKDQVASDLYDLYQRTKATDVLPKEPPAGLTPEQQTAFRKAQGVAAKAAAQAEFNKPDYDGLSPDEQVKRLRRAMQKVYDEQKKKLAK
jgi:hypothetical protein